MKDTFCSHCGAQLNQPSYPKKCGSCGAEFYSNPTPVVLVLIPVIEGGLVIARRNIEPQLGKVALVGGYMETGETIEEAGAREVREEIEMEVTGLKLLGVESNSRRTNVLIFLEADPVPATSVKKISNSEVQEVIIATGPTEMAFPAHQAYFDRILAERSKIK